MEYSESFIIPELPQLISRHTSWCAQQFSENTPNLKLRSMVYLWNDTNRNEIMKLLAFLLLHRLQ
jgi:hypothetical protein